MVKSLEQLTCDIATAKSNVSAIINREKKRKSPPAQGLSQLFNAMNSWYDYFIEGNGSESKITRPQRNTLEAKSMDEKIDQLNPLLGFLYQGKRVHKRAEHIKEVVDVVTETSPEIMPYVMADVLDGNYSSGKNPERWFTKRKEVTVGQFHQWYTQYKDSSSFSSKARDRLSVQYKSFINDKLHRRKSTQTVDQWYEATVVRYNEANTLFGIKVFTSVDYDKLEKEKSRRIKLSEIACERKRKADIIKGEIESTSVDAYVKNYLLPLDTDSADRVVTGLGGIQGLSKHIIYDMHESLKAQRAIQQIKPSPLENGVNSPPKISLKPPREESGEGLQKSPLEGAKRKDSEYKLREPKSTPGRNIESLFGQLAGKMGCEYPSFLERLGAVTQLNPKQRDLVVKLLRIYPSVGSINNFDASLPGYGGDWFPKDRVTVVANYLTNVCNLRDNPVCNLDRDNPDTRSFILNMADQFPEIAPEVVYSTRVKDNLAERIGWKAFHTEFGAHAKPIFALASQYSEFTDLWDEVSEYQKLPAALRVLANQAFNKNWTGKIDYTKVAKAVSFLENHINQSECSVEKPVQKSRQAWGFLESLKSVFNHATQYITNPLSYPAYS